MCKKGLVTAGLCCCVSMLGWAVPTEAAPDKARGGTERDLTRSTLHAAAAANKVTICHKADTKKFLQLSVAASAIPGHLRHGDCVVDDGVSCTVDSCNSVLGCVHAPDNGACDDGNACTGDTCNPATGCVYAPVNCDDNDACTADSCDPTSGCHNNDNHTCGACCLSDGSCDDHSTADECTAQGGEPQGPGTECVTTQCCIPRGESFCQNVLDCCNDGSPMTCVGNRCCGPTGQPGGCVDPADCCFANEVCTANTCCIPRGGSFCQSVSDCCNDGGAIGCVGNRCCGPTGQPGGCVDPADCCFGNEVCEGGKCCVPTGTAGCTDSTDCCGFGFPLLVSCDAGTCREPVIKP